jgi:DNA topoisomerase-1
MARRAGLHVVSADALRLRRRKVGTGFAYYSAQGRKITDPRLLRRLKALAVPPAYTDVRFAENPKAHLQAVGRDAAGRLQYRYHPEWTAIREAHKAAHLAELLETLPRIRRALTRHLADGQPTRELALAAVVELVMHSAIRAGREIYARAHGTRGAATLLKTDVVMRGDTLALTFRAKGGKDIQKEIGAARLVTALRCLRKLPGPRLFQYRDSHGHVRTVRAREVNAFITDVSGARVTLKDFRTLSACVTALGSLLRTLPAAKAGVGSRQLREAVKAASEELCNSPTMCRKSYVRAVVDALAQRKVANKLVALQQANPSRRPEKVLAELLQIPPPQQQQAVPAAA